MTTPCTQQSAIRELHTLVEGTNSAVVRLCESNGQVAVEIKNLAQKINDSLLDAREHSVKIIHLEEDREVLFARMRRMEDINCPKLTAATDANTLRLDDMRLVLTPLPNKIDALEAFRDKLLGGAKLIMGVPIICAVISATAAVVMLVKN